MDAPAAAMAPASSSSTASTVSAHAAASPSAPAAASASSPQQQRGPNQQRHHRHPKQRRHGDKEGHRGDNKGGKQKQKRRRGLKQPLTKDMPRQLAELLKEPKQALLHRVVKNVGPKVAWQLLKQTLKLEQDGGQEVNALASGKPERFFVVDEASHMLKPRRRTTGGVYFALLKEAVAKDVYRKIYEVEDKKKKEAKKRARVRQRQRMDHTLSKLGFDDLTLAGDGGSGAGQADNTVIEPPASSTATTTASSVIVAPTFASVGVAATATKAEEAQVGEDMELL